MSTAPTNQTTRPGSEVMLWECPACGDLRASNADIEACDCAPRQPIMICRRHATEEEIAAHG
jgi:hypothetical protein